MPGHRYEQEPQTAARPLHAPGAARRGASPLVEVALDLQRRAGNRSVTELVGGSTARIPARGGILATPGGSIGVQREPCTDCPDADGLATPDVVELPESGGGG
jgi:hypothetical protein